LSSTIKSKNAEDLPEVTIEDVSEEEFNEELTKLQYATMPAKPAYIQKIEIEIPKVKMRSRPDEPAKRVNINLRRNSPTTKLKTGLTRHHRNTVLTQ